MGKSNLEVFVYSGDYSFPVANSLVQIRTSDGELLYELMTDESGKTAPVELSAPDVKYTLDKNYTRPAYSVYDVDISHEGFDTKHVMNVEIVDTANTYLPVDLHPEPNGYTDDEYIEITPVGLLLNEEQLQVGSNRSTLREVFIPDYITVHLGTPSNTAARNVRVRFTDYVKNVASSEIYPTWPYNSLVANILCIITFALNRVYTEWYRSRGLPFDITNSTAYDQYFVDGRNIFDNISKIVDNIFNNYARRFGFKNPFFTEYCNGTTATCRGLSQWGTVTLANQGYTPLEILRYYYPNDLEIVSTDNIQGIATSYPGYSLRLGSSGEAVMRVQNFLNRIRLNYPLIPVISNPNGYYGADTQNSVRVFQSVFNLTPDGVVGQATWNKLTQIYVGIIKLAELDSEGIRIGIGQTPPTSIVRQGSRGIDVIELQFIINSLASYYNTLPTLIQDGYFGADTKNAVTEFQRTFGLTPDGIVGRATWNMLYEVYRAVHENAPMPPAQELPPAGAPQYPSAPLKVGSTGADTRIMQTYLNTIAAVYPNIPRVTVDGIFGNQTRNAVVAFQQQFLLVPDGIIGPATWNKIVEMFALVTGAASISLEYPGTPLSMGSTGQNVRTMQTFLTELRSKFRDIPEIAIDGIFGSQTRNAVIAFQRLFGLTPDGIIGPATWEAIVRERAKL